MRDPKTAGGGFGRQSAARDTVDLSADFQYESKGRVTEDGYEVEIRIPFKSIRYQGADEQDWGIQVIRKVQRSGYEDTWAPARRAASFLSQSGKLVGLTQLARGITVDLNPVTTAKVDGSSGTSGAWTYDTGRPQPGGNVRWGVTNNLTLNGTVNRTSPRSRPTWRESCSTPRSRTFFPEKRPFFVEGSEQFETPNQLIYTRSVADPLAAVKLSGKLSGTDVGVLAAVDDRTLSNVPTPASPARPVFGFLRVRRDLAGQSTIGAVFTDREDGENYNRVFGADARFVLGGIYTARLQWAHSLSRLSGVTTSGPLFDVGFNRRGRQLQLNYALRGFHENFRSESGFIRRVDIVTASASQRNIFYLPPGKAIETFSADVSMTSSWFYGDFFRGGGPTDLRLTTNGTFVLRGGWRVSATLFVESWKFDQKFYANKYIERTLPGGTKDTLAYNSYIPGGPNDRTAMATLFNLQTPPGARLSVSASLGIGTDANFPEWAQAWLIWPTVTATWRPTDQLRIEARYLHHQYNRRTDGTTVQLRRVPRLKIEYQLARPIFVRLVGQYESFTLDSLRDGSRSDSPVLLRQADGSFQRAERFQNNDLRVDVLFSFRPNPGTVLFAGYGSSLTETDAFSFRDIRRTSDGFFFKLSYLLRVGG